MRYLIFILLLLPKLQSYFAEFLLDGSLIRLCILYLYTCVGFGTVSTFLKSTFFLPVLSRLFPLASFNSSKIKFSLETDTLPDSVYPIIGNLILSAKMFIQRKEYKFFLPFFFVTHVSILSSDLSKKPHSFSSSHTEYSATQTIFILISYSCYYAPVPYNICMRYYVP